MSDSNNASIPSHLLGALREVHLGQVTDNADPDGRGRVKVRLQALDMELWASVVAPSAGEGYGVSLLPRQDEIVIVAFVSPEFAVILGAIWNGQGSHPESAQAVEERYTIETPAGTKMLFRDDEPSFEISTPNGYRLKVRDDNGGSIEITRGEQLIELDSSSINITASAEVKVNAPQVKVEAAMVDVTAGMSQFSGVVKCDTLISNSVISSSYTPGAGNIW